MGEVVRLADYERKQKQPPEQDADIVELNLPPRFHLIDGVLVQFPPYVQEPD